MNSIIIGFRFRFRLGSWEKTGHNIIIISVYTVSFSLFCFALFVVMLPASNIDVFVGNFLSSHCLLLRFLLCDLCHVFNMVSCTNTACLSTRPEVLFRVSCSLFSLYVFVLINVYVVHRLNMLTQFFPLLFAVRLYQNETVKPILNFNVNASDHFRSTISSGQNVLQPWLFTISEKFYFTHFILSVCYNK